MFTADTTGGVVRIIVTSINPAKVTVTHKAKSAGNRFVWIVFNATVFDNANVCVANFARKGGGALPTVTFLQNQDCVDLIPGSNALIAAHVTGASGDVYTYDVKVGGAVVIDPELEI
jgi:hypothetical protein